MVANHQYVIMFLNWSWGSKEIFLYLVWTISVLILLFLVFKLPACCHVFFATFQGKWWRQCIVVRFQCDANSQHLGIKMYVYASNAYSNEYSMVIPENLLQIPFWSPLTTLFCAAHQAPTVALPLARRRRAWLERDDTLKLLEAVIWLSAMFPSSIPNGESHWPMPETELCWICLTWSSD